MIEAPWVIVGLPGTGASVLSLLLGADPAARTLLQWEAAHPVPPATAEAADSDPRIAQTDRELAGLLRLNRPLRAPRPGAGGRLPGERGERGAAPADASP